jgi:hypothetical protein
MVAAAKLQNALGPSADELLVPPTVLAPPQDFFSRLIFGSSTSRALFDEPFFQFSPSVIAPASALIIVSNYRRISSLPIN